MTSEWPHHPSFTGSELLIMFGFLGSGGVFGCFAGLELADLVSAEGPDLAHGIGAFVGTAFGLFVGSIIGALLVRLTR